MCIIIPDETITITIPIQSESRGGERRGEERKTRKEEPPMRISQTHTHTHTHTHEPTGTAGTQELQR